MFMILKVESPRNSVRAARTNSKRSSITTSTRVSGKFVNKICSTSQQLNPFSFLAARNSIVCYVRLRLLKTLYNCILTPLFIPNLN